MLEENANERGDDTKKITGNRQRLFANFQYDWICIKQVWEEEEIYRTSAPSNCDAVSAAPKAFVFMVGCSSFHSTAILL